MRLFNINMDEICHQAGSTVCGARSNQASAASNEIWDFVVQSINAGQSVVNEIMQTVGEGHGVNVAVSGGRDIQLG